MSSKSLTAPGFSEGSTRVLFIGNSHTYTNNLPGLFIALARSVGDDKLEAASVAYPDFALEDHWSEGTALRSLSQNTWEFVVMQQGSSALPASQVHLRTWASQFAPRIRAAGAVPVMFQVWPSIGRPGDFPAVLESYRSAAGAIDGIIAPAGDAWVAYGDVSRLYGDDIHGNIKGTYIAAVVLLNRIRGIRPDQLPGRIPGYTFEESEIRALQSAAQTALNRVPARSSGVTPTERGAP